MMRWRNIVGLALDQLIVKKKKNLAVIITVGAAFFLTFSAILQFAVAVQPISGIRKLFGKDADRYYNISLTYFSVDDITMGAKVLDFVSGLEKLEEVEAAGYVSKSSAIFQELITNEAFLDINGRRAFGTESNGGMSGAMAESVRRYASLQYVSSSDFLEYMQLSYHLEYPFAVEDGIYPLLVGAAFRDVIAVGDILTQNTREGERQYRVVGFTEAGASFLSANGVKSGVASAEYEFFTLSDYDQVPEEQIAGLGMALAKSIYWVKKDSVSSQEAVLAVNALAYRCRLSQDSMTVNDICRKRIADAWEELRPLVIFVLFVLGVSVVSVTTVMTVTLLMQQKDFGVLYANGMSGRDMLRMLFIENAIKITVALALALLCYEMLIQRTYWPRVQETYYALYPVAIPVLVLTAVLLLLVSTVVPAVLLYKKRPSDLLRGSSQV